MITKEQKVRCKIFTREEVTDMLKGATLPMKLFGHSNVIGRFTYSDQYGKFSWNYGAFDDLSNEQIYYIYLMCKDFKS